MTKPNEDGISRYDSEIRRLYLVEKLSDAQVAATLPIEVTGSGIYHYRTRNGIKGHRRGAKSSLDEHRDEIIALYTESKWSDAQIAEKYGVTNEAVRRARRRWNISTDRHKATGRFSTNARFEEVKDQLPAAWERSKRWHPRQKRMVGSSARVAKEFGVGMSTAQRWLAELGFTEKRSAHGDEAPAKALALFDSGLSVPATARELNIPEDTVRNWISGHRDLSNAASRRSHEEQLAFRRTISAAKASSVAGSGRYNYEGTRLDSTAEVRFAKNCDRLELGWTAWDRAEHGVCEVNIDGEVVRYAPDFLVGDVAVEVKGVFDALAAAKVSAWRKTKGELAMVMKQELLDLEGARSDQDALAVLQAACYLDPPTDPAFWD